MADSVTIAVAMTVPDREYMGRVAFIIGFRASSHDGVANILNMFEKQTLYSKLLSLGLGSHSFSLNLPIP